MIIRYLPQVYMNYKNKSTEGWSISNVICEFVGLVSFLVILIGFKDSSIIKVNREMYYGDLIAVIINLMVCGVFLIQHYLLYAINSSVNTQLDVYKYSGNSCYNTINVGVSVSENEKDSLINNK